MAKKNFLINIIDIEKDNKGDFMIKNKSIDYIFGMITGASLMLAFWACTQTPLGASGSTVQEVKVVNESWNPVHVTSTDN